MDIEIRSVQLAGSPCRTRLPFRFGITTLIEAPAIVARVRIAVGGLEVEGFSGDLTVPKWFEKDPNASAADDLRSLFASAWRAARAFTSGAGSPFAIWRAAHERCTGGDLASGVGLVDGFGVALVERAMLDAVCRAAGISFRAALEQDVFGFDAGALLPEAAAVSPSSLVVAHPPASVVVRHTVGGLDALRSKDVRDDLRHDDGHPVALEDDIRRFGLRAFKLKIGSGPEADLQRLAAIARVVAEQGVREPIYTLDGNEQYAELRQLGRLLELLAADADARAILDGLAYIEQPLPRAATFDPASADDVRALSSFAPLLIDEADCAVDSFARALELGYLGVSVKNCKGVFRALANRALCLARGDGAFQSSEDLTNLPVLALQQDLSTLAALGLPHSERNGHHYFAGLEVVPPGEAEAALAAQPDLYERRGDRIELRIRDGRVSLACQHSVGYGYSSSIDWDARAPLDALVSGLTG